VRYALCVIGSKSRYCIRLNIARQDKLVWDEELEQDFSPGGKHAAALEKIDAEIGAGNFRPMP
jgi:hypothetical protein